MKYIQKLLSKDENLIESFKMHWLSLVIPILFTFFSGGICFFLILIRNSKEMGITSKRLIKKTGWLSRTTNELILKKVETVEVKQGILGRIFGYGNVKISGTGTSDLVFDMVDNPFEVKKQVDNVVNDLN